MKMYLLFEWTEEREAKNIYGIYSTVEKAKEVVDISEGGAPVEWSDELYEDGTLCAVTGFVDGTDEDYPYEIIPFEVDVYEDSQWGPGTDNPTRTRHEL